MREVSSDPELACTRRQTHLFVRPPAQSERSPPLSTVRFQIRVAGEPFESWNPIRSNRDSQGSVITYLVDIDNCLVRDDT